MKNMPSSSAKTADLKRRRKILCAITTGIMVVIILLLMRSCGPTVANAQDWFDANARAGSYIGKTTEEIKADLARQIAENKMNISICSNIVFPNGSLNSGSARIENIAANHFDQKVTITLIDTNEEVYASGAIAPGNTIDYITLNKNLSPGVYNAIAVFTGYVQETHEEHGSLAAEIKLTIE